MAVYKPTDCTPFNDAFDINDVIDGHPFFIECKIDTSNVKIEGYSIEIYDSENNKIFPPYEENIGYKITHIDDLNKITTQDGGKYYDFYKNRQNINTGYNGTWLKIPIIVSEKDKQSIYALRETDTESETISRNLANKNLFKNGKQYFWRIALYQNVYQHQEYKSLIHSPNDPKYYDMTVQTGQVMGSTNKRIQTKKIDTNESLLDKYIQPIFLNDLQENSDGTFSYKSKSETYPCNRVLISDYDYSFGYIYPNNVGNEVIPKEQMNKNEINAFQIYKNGNNVENLAVTDMVDYVVSIPIYDDRVSYTIGSVDYTWEWVEQSVSSNSYWKETYELGEQFINSGRQYFQFNGNTKIPENSRVVFNNCQKQAQSINGKYMGSPYNGIFYPTYDISSEKNENDKYLVTVIWNRCPDANTWGKLLNKVIYVNGKIVGDSDSIHTGENIQINLSGSAGSINNSPFMFVKEKPIQLYSGSEINKENCVLQNTNNFSYLRLSKPIQKINYIKMDGANISPSKYSFEQESNIITIDKSILTVNNKFEVGYVQSTQNCTIGIIFYNSDKKIYIRPSNDIQNGMMLYFQKQNIYSKIVYYNNEYQYITFDISVNNIYPDERYQIKSFFKYSDYNPFYFYSNPKIQTKYKYIGMDNYGHEFLVRDNENIFSHRNVKIYVTYDQDQYIHWKSYSFMLFASDDNYNPISLIDSKEETYNGEISFSIYGLNDLQNYLLIENIISETGQVFQEKYPIYVQINDQIYYDTFPVSTWVDCENNAVISKVNNHYGIIIPESSDNGSKILQYKTIAEMQEKEQEIGANMISWIVADDDNNEVILSKKSDDNTSQNTICEVYHRNEIDGIHLSESIKYEKILQDRFSNYTVDLQKKISEMPVTQIRIPDESEQIVIESQHILSPDLKDPYFGTIMSVTDEKDRSIQFYLGNVLDSSNMDLYEDRNSILIAKNKPIKIYGINTGYEYTNQGDFLNIGSYIPYGYKKENSNRTNILHIKNIYDKNGIKLIYENPTNDLSVFSTNEISSNQIETHTVSIHNINFPLFNILDYNDVQGEYITWCCDGSWSPSGTEYENATELLVRGQHEFVYSDRVCKAISKPIRKNNDDIYYIDCNVNMPFENIWRDNNDYELRFFDDTNVCGYDEDVLVRKDFYSYYINGVEHKEEIGINSYFPLYINNPIFSLYNEMKENIYTERKYLNNRKLTFHIEANMNFEVNETKSYVHIGEVES